MPGFTRRRPITTLAPPRQHGAVVAAKGVGKTIKVTYRAGKHTWRAGRWLVKKQYRYRRVLAPAYTAAALAATAEGLHHLDNGVRTAVVLAVLLGFVIRRKITTRKGARRHARTLITAAATAAAYLLGATIYGPGAGALPGLLVAAGIGFGIPWWRYACVRPRPMAEDAAEQITTWETRVAGARGSLTGSTLTDVTADEYGNWCAKIKLPAGEKTYNDAISAAPRIASAYGIPVPSVSIEAPDDGRADEAKIAVYNTNPLRYPKPWDGPEGFDAATGIAVIGRYADSSPLLYRFWMPRSGPRHTLIAGTTDSGKSRLVSQLLAYERHATDADGNRLFSTWLIDPQHGQSLPEWQDHVDHFAPSADAGLDMLHELHRMMLDRNRKLARLQWVDEDGLHRKGVSYFTPTADMPIISVTIEEAHAVLRLPGAREVIEALATQARKCGIKLRLIVQVPLLDQLGGSTVLRDALRSGNVIVLRTANSLSGQVALADLKVDPASIPREWPIGDGEPEHMRSTGGLCYASGIETRQSMARIDYVEKPAYWATTGTTLRLADVEPDIAASAPIYLDAYRRSRGQVTADEPTESTATPTTTAAAGQTPPAARRGEQAKAADKITAYLNERGHPARTRVIAHACDLPLPTVSTTLQRMADDGRATHVRHGTWALPSDAAVRMEETA